MRRFVQPWLIPALAPLLLTVYPLLYLYASNIEQLSFDDVVRTLLICLGVTLMGFVFLSAVLRSVQRGAMLTAILVILFYAYGHVHGILNPSSHRYLLIPWAMGLTASTVLILWKGDRLRFALTYLTLVAGVLVVMPLLQISAYLVSAASRPPVRIDTQDLSFQPIIPDSPPDIYYIILDGYTRTDILQDYYGYDNAPFVNALEAQGFYVASESRSNYVQTFLSLASSLNMSYLTLSSQETAASLGTERAFLYPMIQDGQVWDFLDSAGYTLIQLSSGWGPTDYNPYADVNFTPSYFSEFEANLLQTTLLKPFYEDWAVEDFRRRILTNFEELGHIAARREPTFTFAHFLLPHPPYAFGPEGQETDYPFEMGGDIWFETGGYRDQVIFTNRQILTLVERILADSVTPPIIILQGDHGSASHNEGWWERNATLVRERTAILNAYYLPGDGANRLYPSITPVNSFRLIFDAYFGQEFELVEDHVYFSDYEHPYQLDEVT